MRLTSIFKSIREKGFVQIAFFSITIILAISGQLYLLKGFLIRGISLYLVAIFAFLFIFRVEGDEIVTHRPFLNPRIEYLFFIFIVIIAVFMRFYKISSIPSGCFFDEGLNGLWGVRILKYHVLPIYLENRAALLFYLNAIMFKIAGINVTSLRMVSAVTGVGSVIVLFFLARNLFGSRIALIASFLLAITRWHVTFSRINFECNQHVLFSLLAIYLLLKAIKSERVLYFILLGIVSGIGIYTYTAFRATLLLLFVYLIYEIIRDRGFLKRNFRKILVTGLIFLIICIPIINYARHNTFHFMWIMRQLSLMKQEYGLLENISLVVESLKKYVLMFNYAGDFIGRHNIPGYPMLSFFTSIFFICGILITIRNWRDSRYLLCLGWFMLMLIPGILSEYGPNANRVMGVVPVVCIFAGLFISYMWDFCIRVFGKGGGYYPLIFIVPILIYEGYANYNIYFVKQANHLACWRSFSTTHTEIARYIKSQGRSYDLYLQRGWSDHRTIHFINFEERDNRYFDLNRVDHIPIKDESVQDSLYFFPPDNRLLIELLKMYYPHGGFKEFMSPYNESMFLSCEVSKEDIEESRGLLGRYYRGITFNGKPILERIDRGISYDGGIDRLTTIKFPYSVKWEGQLNFPQYGEYTLGIESNSPTELYIDDSLMIRVAGGDSGKSEINFCFPRGPQNITINHTVVDSSSMLRLYWITPEGNREVIPSLYLYHIESLYGLLGTYYSGPDVWDGEPFSVQVDPIIVFDWHVLPEFNKGLLIPFSIIWEGYIDIKRPGSYRIYTRHQSGKGEASWLHIDNRLVYESEKIHQGIEPQEVYLKEGLHSILIKYTMRVGHFQTIWLCWEIDGGDKELVPLEALYPKSVCGGR